MFLGLRERGCDRIANGLRPGAAGEARQHRPHIDQETNKYRDRISGEAEHHTIADLAEAHRASGLYGNLPKMTLADGVDGSSHMVLGALARAAGNYQHIVITRCLRQGLAYAIGPVRQDAEINWHCTRDFDQPLQHWRIGVIDLARHEWI